MAMDQSDSEKAHFGFKQQSYSPVISVNRVNQQQLQSSVSGVAQLGGSNFFNGGAQETQNHEEPFRNITESETNRYHPLTTGRKT